MLNRIGTTIQNLDERFRIDNAYRLVCIKPLKFFITRHYKISLRFHGTGNYLVISRVRRHTGKDKFARSAIRLISDRKDESPYTRFR